MNSQIRRKEKWSHPRWKDVGCFRSFYRWKICFWQNKF